MNQESLKRQAAHVAVEFIRSGTVVGLGHGSTTAYAVEELASRLRSGKLINIVAIPCSLEVQRHARQLGIPLTSLEEHPCIDLTIDGADEVDPRMDLIKGGGGALLREKVVAGASRREIIIVDGSKLSPRLGTRFALPVEVVPFAWNLVRQFVETLGAHVARRGEGTPFVTDQGNYILDCRFPGIDDAAILARRLEHQAGIVEHGLFLGVATDLVVAGTDGVKHYRRGAQIPLPSST